MVDGGNDGAKFDYELFIHTTDRTVSESMLQCIHVGNLSLLSSCMETEKNCSQLWLHITF